jgi:membrane-associated phospholipid phosphatase
MPAAAAASAAAGRGGVKRESAEVLAAGVSFDTALLRLFRTRGHQPALETAVRRFSQLGEHGFLWYSVSAVGAAASPEHRRTFGRAAALVFGSFVANQAVKFVARRPRPDLPGLPPLVHTMSNRSYPSAHATTSAAAAMGLSGVLPAGPVWGVAALLALSRLYLGVHYPSDTVAGFALGVAVAELAP